ncbi:hypothetical protein FACS1894200_09680 [Spirochaetia bacterium]|nr:hypothetical protein FACS1894200_09680 [Spirochaetia bacterium]
MLTLDTGNHFKDKRLGKRAGIILALIVSILRVATWLNVPIIGLL